MKLISISEIPFSVKGKAVNKDEVFEAEGFDAKYLIGIGKAKPYEEVKTEQKEEKVMTTDKLGAIIKKGKKND